MTLARSQTSLRHRVVDLVMRSRYGKLIRKMALRDVSQRGHHILCRMPDHVILLKPDDWMSERIYENGHWQRPELETAVNFLSSRGRLREKGAFLDIGANIGTQTVYAHLTGYFSRFLCVEPDPDNFALLISNIQLNGLTSQTILTQQAAGARHEVLKLFRFQKYAGRNSLVRGPDPRHRLSGTMDVPVSTVDSILNDAGIGVETVSLVWVDVEGFEPSALEGMNRLLALQTPMVVEFNGAIYDPQRRIAFAEFLAKHFNHCGRLLPTTVEECSFAALAEQQKQIDIVLF